MTTPPAYLLRHPDLATKTVPRSKTQSQERRDNERKREIDDADRLIDHFVSKDLYSRDQCPRPEIVDGIKIYYHYLDQLDAEDYGIFLEPFIMAESNRDDTWSYSVETYDEKLGVLKNKADAVHIAKKHESSKLVPTA